MRIEPFSGISGRLQVFLFAIVMAFLACVLPPQAAGLTVTDMAGRKVELPAKVDRILLGEGRLFHALALLEGKQDPFARLAGWQGDFRELDPQSYARYKAKFPHADDVPLIGKTNENTISAEKVLELRPDIAVFSIGGGHGPQVGNPLVELLQKVGVPVIFLDFRVDPVGNTVPSLRLLGKAIQREQQAEAFIEFYEATLDQVAQRVKAVPAEDRPRVFLDVRGGGLPDVSTAGNGSLGQFVQLAGGDNVGSALIEREMGPVNIEYVLASKPEFYVATGAGSAGRPGLRMGAETDEAVALDTLAVTSRRDALHGLPVVAEGNVYGIWHHFYVTPFHAVLVQTFAKWFHPEQFADIDPAQTWRDMHHRFLPIEASGTFWVAGPESRAVKADAGATAAMNSSAQGES